MSQGTPAALLHFQQAGVLLQTGRYEEALTEAELAVAKRPDVLATHLRAAAIEMQLGRHRAALERLDACCRTGSDRAHQGDARLLTLKAHLLRLLDRYDEALALCRDGFAKGIESADLMHAYALALQSAGAETKALAVYDQAAVAATRPAEVLSDKAVLLTELGRLGEACETFDRALALAPTLADAWYNKTNAKTYATGDPDIEAMERLIGDGHGPYRDRLLLHFALGKAYMEAGDADAAFRHWHEGNRMKRAIVDYDADAMAERMASIAARPTYFGAAAAAFPKPGDGASDCSTDRVADRSTNHANDRATGDAADRASDTRYSELPVFIVGMPRSGSSLIEQIIASHPDVRSAGETSGLRALFEEPLPGANEPAGGGVEDRIAATALQRLRGFGATSKRVVDKDLQNFLHLGTIHRLLPRARIIHCRRDPLDSCFSAYTKLFIGDLNFSYALAELGRYFVGYHALMQHWRSVLPPETFLEIDYEALVIDPRTQTSRLLEFLGLPWNEACLRFFETPRKVSTASLAQVRRPIYRSSVGRAQSVRHQLQPLIATLGELVPAVRAEGR
jgi:tetratricopeptide (TPR) repeat protein